ncbi:MAG TPA: C4-type zinc ribbon domain-containing protein [Candidatus Saccharimonadales bacterium]|nr:C4-type zinc ribbon domain-containing protein [Candidatus Saccharimonadales bacterium]
MEPFYKKLVEYQDLNLQISSLDARLAEIPDQLARIDAEEEAAAGIVHRAKERRDESLKQRREFERELKDLEQKVDKYNDQSREVKTNEQYRAIMSEIQNVKTHIGDVEEKILLSMEETDELSREIGEAEKQVASRKKEFDGSRKSLTEEREGLTTRRRGLDTERTALAATIPGDLMETYSKVAQLRGDVVMATFHDELCTGCSVRLRPALMAEVRKGESLFQCESCRRILYYVKEPEAPQEGEATGTVRPADDASGAAAPDPGAS